MIFAGVDDAGRGSVLGPLVIAGVSIDESKIPELKELGVKDSKLLSPQKRQYLYKKIKKIASGIAYEKIDPTEIDKVVFNGQKLFRLNYLEARMMSSVLHKLKFDMAFVDCCDTNQTRFGQLISDMISEKDGKTFTVGEKNPLFDRIKSEHHADRNYPVVSAASIVAKVTRDTFVKRLHKKHGMFGSGYPSDPDTISYLRTFYESSKEFPTITRLSWLTIRRMQDENIKENMEILQAVYED
ncbi:MAG: ribonuclease HII [Thaumarchaeota archaeon]|nr:ribonuclease HII [Nitrososphaerota archaeon]